MKGSGNVGAMNSFEVTNSKMTGIIVFSADFLKGIIVVLIAKYFIDPGFSVTAAAIIAAITGHCYSPWIGFKGGRGLAAAAGGNLLLSPLILAGWIILWLGFYLIKKNIIISNFIATLIMWFFCVIFVQFFFNFTFPFPVNKIEFIIYVSALFFIILMKHLAPIRGLFK